MTDRHTDIQTDRQDLPIKSPRQRLKTPHREVGGAHLLSGNSLLYCTICANWNFKKNLQK